MTRLRAVRGLASRQLFPDVNALVGKIADAWREFESERMKESKDVIGKAVKPAVSV
jgi:hypothetical protein